MRDSESKLETIRRRHQPSREAQATHNKGLILSLTRPLGSLEKLEIAELIVGQSLTEGLEFPIDVEEGLVRGAQKYLRMTISNFKEATRYPVKR